MVEIRREQQHPSRAWFNQSGSAFTLYIEARFGLAELDPTRVIPGARAWRHLDVIDAADPAFGMKMCRMVAVRTEDR